MGWSAWKDAFREARTQILLWYAGSMLLFVSIAVPTLSRVLWVQVERRVWQAVQQQTADLRATLEADPPNTPQQLRALMQEILTTESVKEDGFLIAISQGQFDQASPALLPMPIAPGSELMEQWLRSRVSQQGKQKVQDPELGTIFYGVEPVLRQGELWGTFVVAHTTAGEQQEIAAMIGVVLWVLLSLWVLAVALAWVAIGQILNPLRQIANTARLISETNLSQRISVRGQGELSVLSQTLNQMLDRLQAAFANQRAFVNDASHELRTPIAIIQGHLELIGELPQEQQEVVDLVLDETERMSRFVQDLLVLSQAEHPDFLSLQPVDLETMTDEIFNKAKGLVKCNLKLDHRARGEAILDRSRITQALLNLVENATQHTSATDLIALGSDISDAHVCFWVRDTGSGIELGDQQRIFQRFARARQGPRCSDGAGLGLSIVKAIAQASGGRIELYSRPSRGSTFMLILPVPSRDKS